MRATSRTAYEEIVAEGLLPQRQLEVYMALYHAPMSTGQELAKQIPGAWKRLPELRRMGLVVEHETKVCSVTGRKAICWICTSKLPDRPGM